MTGHYRMQRGWQDHPALAGGSFDRRSAWQWLIEHASFKGGKVNAGGKTVPLKRGQLCHSYRHLAGVWGWSTGAVQRFINRLKTDTMIDTASVNGRLIITLCNYNKYQASCGDEKPATDTQADTAPIRDRYKVERRKVSKKEDVEDTRYVPHQGQGQGPASGPGMHDAVPFPDPDEQGQHGLLPQVEWFEAHGYDRRTGNLPPGELDELSLNFGRTSDEQNELSPAADPAPVELAAEPITSPPPILHQPAAGADNVTYLADRNPPAKGRRCKATGDANFDEFWAAYPKREDKTDAHRAYATALRRPDTTHAIIMAGLARYIEKIEQDGTAYQYVKQPATFLSKGTYLNEPNQGAQHGNGNQQQRRDGGGNLASRIVNAFGVSGIPR